jgi:hypothetical protein
MLSWKKLNASITWLRNFVLTPVGTAWDGVKQWPVSSVIGVAGVIFVVFFFKEGIWNFLNHIENGKIIVNSPTVYTRQRLVNDRLDQARWLRTQLDFTEANKREREFQSIDAIHHVSSATKATAGIDASQSAPSDSDQQKKLDGDISVDSTTMAQFRAKNAYREEVRSEITQTELDDRHDIKGNTIFRLTFDTSVLAGTNKGAVAAIVIRLGHDPKNEKSSIKDIYTKDYQSLFENWASKFQDTIATSLSSVSESINSSTPQPHLRLLFSDFLLRRICQFVSGKTDISAGPPECGANQKRKAESLLALYTRIRLARLREQKDQAFLNALYTYKTNEYNFPPGKPIDFVAAAANECIVESGVNNDQIALWKLGIARVPQKETSTTGAAGSDPNSKESALVSERRPERKFGTQEDRQIRIGCPFYDSVRERFISGVLLYEKLIAVTSNSPTEKEAFRPETSVTQNVPSNSNPSPVSNTAPTVPKNWFEDEKLPATDDYEAFAARAIDDLGDCARSGACFVSSSRLRCFAADFIKSNLNYFADPSSRHSQKIGDFLTLKIVGRETNDCNLIVMPFPESFDRLSSRPAEFSSTPDFAGFLEKFREALNENTDAFAYSVTPKNLAESVSTAAETRDAYELLVRARSKTNDNDIASFLRTRSEQNRAIIAHPIVVGFGSSNFPSGIFSGGVRDIDFGWIVAGRLSDDGGLEQVDGQYPLSTYISVPGWWQTVKVSIVTCWLTRTAVAKLTPVLSAKNVCPNGEVVADQIPVRLPPAIAEISHKLGFDVVQQPSIFHLKQQELVVGQPGALLLEGQWLWRSTEVTAGAQHADKITVLPNMEGILAEFDCVLPPAGERQAQSSETADTEQIVTNDFVRVWTSEGVAEPVPVVFVWPKNWEKATKVDCDKRLVGQSMQKSVDAPTPSQTPSRKVPSKTVAQTVQAPSSTAPVVIEKTP